MQKRNFMTALVAAILSALFLLVIVHVIMVKKFKGEKLKMPQQHAGMTTHEKGMADDPEAQ